jgi:hypothetical protein
MASELSTVSRFLFVVAVVSDPNEDVVSHGLGEAPRTAGATLRAACRATPLSTAGSHSRRQ